MKLVAVEVAPPPIPAIAESLDDPATTPMSTKVDAAETDVDVARLGWDIVDEWGDQSFPASDPPANW